MLRHLSPLLFCLFAGPVGAATLNVPIAVRVMGFTQPPIAGPLTVSIVVEPGHAGSEAEAAAIERQVGTGMAVGRVTVRVRRMSATTAPSGMAGAQVLFVTSGVRAQQPIADAAARGGVLTITSDIGCVRAGRCVVGITGDAQPLIVVSRAAARAARIRFGLAFLMLVKEI